MSLIDNIKKGTRLTAELLYDLVYGLSNGDLDTPNNNLPLWRKNSLANYVVSGCVWSGDSYGSTRYASMTSGQIVIGGAVVDITSVANRLFTASKDTYVDVDANGILYYTEVTNNAASPALSTGRMRLGIIVTGASSIAADTSINQGQAARTLPTTCNTKGNGKDSLGNYIYYNIPTNPGRIEQQTIYSKQANGSGSVGDGYYMFIGDVLYQTGTFYVGNGFTGWTNSAQTFAKAFTTNPIVIICSTSPVADSEADNGYPCSVRSVSTTGFTARIYHGNVTLGAGYSWIAIGKA